MNNNITKNAFLIIYSFYFPLLFHSHHTSFFLKKQTQQFYAMSRREVAIFFYLIGFLLVHILVYVYVIYAFSYLLMCMCVCYCRRKIHFSCVHISWVFVAFLIDIHSEDKSEKICRKCNCMIFLTNIWLFDKCTSDYIFEHQHLCITRQKRVKLAWR